MKRYIKLLIIWVIIGFNTPILQIVQARPYVRKSTPHKINKTKKAVPYHLRKKIDYTPNIDANDLNASESGIASWYGGRFQNHRTSSGERLNNHKLTAAHPSLPLGSKAIVRSEDTGSSVIVTINDRGPFIKHRIIDLSKAAAAKIGMLHKGTAHVTVTPLSNTEVAEAPQ